MCPTKDLFRILDTTTGKVPENGPQALARMASRDGGELLCLLRHATRPDWLRFVKTGACHRPEVGSPRSDSVRATPAGAPEFVL
jgi:hypothetical protein